MNIEARFKVQGVSSIEQDGKKCYESVTLLPVYSEDKTSENYKWSQATPAGSIQMTISNPGAWGAFVEGKEYSVEFSPIEDGAGE